MKTTNAMSRAGLWILFSTVVIVAVYLSPTLINILAPKDDSVQGELAFEIGSSIHASTGEKAVTIPGAAKSCSQAALLIKLSSCIVIGIHEPIGGVPARVYDPIRNVAIARAGELAAEGRLSEPAIITVAFYRLIDGSYGGGLTRSALQRHFVETTSISIICREGKCS